ncbi:uncharacterized protein CMU_021480 [Cryptosporidium muris RN66]|uniref:methylated diphthine methylhydrolase n=1 Tax=Cryptosporidium muris (strain RN66) TaxID=441375 RepID=B6AJJ3_CRYMR|nr:uncharacterized protein CMU_021480 [Cryptosporidium muris RN66]EEA08384.1 hypothetical protein, conserved [Cryptosporidium muris RN66]|eukprot:XP_002142733.1 hypothetical protein [Cryptosporidium muris RN66]
MNNLSILSSIECLYPTDCLALNKDEEILAVGMYNLDGSNKERIGGISLYNTKDLIQKKGTYSNIFINTGTGVLNCMWDKSTLQGIGLVCICSDRTLRLYKYGNNNLFNLASKIETGECPNSSVIGLDMDILDQKDIRRACFSLSDGRVCIVKDMTYLEREFNAHNKSEVWTLSFIKSENIIATGADDCILAIWDIRCNFTSSIAKNTSHNMGITCITPSCNETSFWTGSYDEYIRYWDIRKLDNAIYEYKMNCGIWRIKVFGNFISLAECHYGFDVLSKDENNEIRDLYASLENLSPLSPSHTSIVYGIEMFNRDNTTFGMSCSFYDKTLLTWRLGN